MNGTHMWVEIEPLSAGVRPPTSKIALNPVAFSISSRARCDTRGSSSIRLGYVSTWFAKRRTQLTVVYICSPLKEVCLRSRHQGTADGLTALLLVVADFQCIFLLVLFLHPTNACSFLARTRQGR